MGIMSEGLLGISVPGEESFYVKRTGDLVAILKITSKSYQDPVLWAWLGFFSLLNRTNSRRTQFLIAIKTIASNTSRYRESFCCVLFEAEHTKSYQNRFFNFQMVQWAPLSIFYRCLPPSPFRISVSVKITRCLISYWHSCLTISALNARSSSPSSIPDQGHCVVFLDKTL